VNELIDRQRKRHIDIDRDSDTETQRDESIRCFCLCEQELSQVISSAIEINLQSDNMNRAQVVIAKVDAMRVCRRGLRRAMEQSDTEEIRVCVTLFALFQ